MIERVSVLGLGTMGHGIVQAFAMAGVPVLAWDEMPAARDSLTARITRNLAKFVEADLLDAPAAEAALTRITVASSEREAVAEVPFVTEAIAENLEVKQQVLARIESLMDREAIIASNSSTYPISASGALLQHPDRAVVTHWFNPPHIVPTVEVVGSPLTSERTIETAIALLRHIGKTPVRVNVELPGFLVNRLQIALGREIWDLLDRGVASAEDIDAAVVGSMGFRLAALGPLRVQDFAGLDIHGHVHEHLVKEISSSTEIPPTVRQILDDGHLGFKSGRGFYTYDPETAQALLDERDRKYLALLKLAQDAREEA